jgi:hypothetical protein
MRVRCHRLRVDYGFPAGDVFAPTGAHEEIRFAEKWLQREYFK